MPKPSQTLKAESPKPAASKNLSSKLSTRLVPLPKRIWYKPWTWAHNLPAPPRTPVPKVRQMFITAFGLLKRHWKVFMGTVLLYGILNLLLVHGLSDPAQLGTFKQLLSNLNVSHNTVFTVFTSFAYLLSTSGLSVTSSSGVYLGILLVIFSLALVYGLRQAIAGHRIRMRDGFYGGMYPLVPVLLILLLMAVQAVPLAAGIYIYDLAVGHGIASDSAEKVAFALPALFLGLWTFRMITSSIFALYIATLPDMTPLRALRSAARLVYKRRLFIWRKLLPLPFIYLLIVAIVELPLILFAPVAAGWVFFVLQLAILPSLHAYVYTLYRELL